jgi:hypothetical protein
VNSFKRAQPAVEIDAIGRSAPERGQASYFDAVSASFDIRGSHEGTEI